MGAIRLPPRFPATHRGAHSPAGSRAGFWGPHVNPPKPLSPCAPSVGKEAHAGPAGLGSARSQGLISINKVNRLRPGLLLALPSWEGGQPSYRAGMAGSEKMAARPYPPA